MSVSFCFFPNRSNLLTISMVAQEKKQKNVSFYVVCMYVRPKLTFVSFFLFFLSTFPLGEGAKKKRKKKLTNVSLYVCMSAENRKMLVFLCFFPNSSNLSTISMVAKEKKHKNVSFYGVCMYVRPKLTFVSFLCFFLCTFP